MKKNPFHDIFKRNIDLTVMVITKRHLYEEYPSQDT